MPKNPETAIVNRIILYLKEVKQNGEPIWFTKLHGGPMQKAGLPDIHVCYHGLAVYLEVKTATGKASPLQEHTIDLIRAAGGVAVVVRSVDEVRSLLDEIRPN